MQVERKNLLFRFSGLGGIFAVGGLTFFFAAAKAKWGAVVGSGLSAAAGKTGVSCG